MFDHYVADYCEVVAGVSVFEEDRVLSVGEIAGYVEGSEVDVYIVVELKVARSGETVQSCWNVHYEITVDKHL